VSAEGREQPVIEPQVETAPAPVADAPDTTPKQEKTAEAAPEKPKRATKKKTGGLEAPAAKPPTPGPEDGGGDS
jgi:hypothetical protein